MRQPDTTTNDFIKASLQDIALKLDAHDIGQLAAETDKEHGGYTVIFIKAYIFEKICAKVPNLKKLLG